MISESLSEYIERFGEAELLRTVEIQAPKDYETFIARLYREISKIIDDLEASPKEHKGQSEDGISLEILGHLRASGYLAIKDPTQGGHVDIFVQPQRVLDYRWYAEAKIWDGVVWNEKGLYQLLTRYANGRQKHLGVFVYCFDPKIVEKMRAWEEHIKERKLCNFLSGQSDNEFVFDTTHEHSSGALVTVRHFGVNLYFSPKV